MKFTKPGIDALTCPPGKRDAMFTDSEVKGFGIRVNATGSKTFLFNYRFAGKPRRLIFGQYGELTLAQARKLAEAARGKVLAGGDPAGDKKAAAHAFQQQVIEEAKQAAVNALRRITRPMVELLRTASKHGGQYDHYGPVINHGYITHYPSATGPQPLRRFRG